MLNEHYDVTTAAYAVGYESLSHFSREYSRMFVTGSFKPSGLFPPALQK